MTAVACLPHYACYKIQITGGAAKSIQSINVVAAAVVVVAAAVAGLASPAATHHIKNCVCGAKQLFFFSFLSFLGQPSLFSNVHACPELVRQQGRAKDFFPFFKKNAEHL